MNAQKPPSQPASQRTLSEFIGLVFRVLSLVFEVIALLLGVLFFCVCIWAHGLTTDALEENITQKQKVEQMIKERGAAADSIEVQDLRLILEGPAELERERRQIRNAAVLCAFAAIAGASWLYYWLRIRPKRLASKR
jgi:hypothetical protein